MKVKLKHKSVPVEQLRPRERVLAYLLAEFERSDLPSGTRLPPMRELAARLRVSVPTVQSALQELARQGRIRTQIGNGTFLISPEEQAVRPLTYRIAINIPMLSSASSPTVWGGRILQEIMHAAARDPRPIMVMPLPQAGLSSESVVHDLMDERAAVDALILFPFKPFAPEVEAAYEQAGKPVIHLNPPAETATANFVSPDYYGASFRLGRAWRETGRRRVLMMVGGALSDTVSGRLRLAGLVNGLMDAAEYRIVEHAPASVEGGRAAMESFLQRSQWVPDAIYCDGDFLALGAIQAMRETGLNVPEDVSVVGGSGLELRDPICRDLTGVSQSYEQLGQELVRMVCSRLELRRQGVASVAGCVVAAPFVGGGSTRAIENKCLGIAG